MSNHLPECPTLDAIPFVDEGWDEGPCICDRLRACEARVRRTDDDYAYVAAQAEANGRRHGRNDALDEARDAVATTGGRMWIGKAETLAAIDALRDTPTRINMEDPL